MGTADAMAVTPYINNQFNDLQTKWRPPKAGVTGSINREAIDQAAPQAQVHPVGVALGHPWPPRHLCILHIARHFLRLKARK